MRAIQKAVVSFSLFFSLFFISIPAHALDAFSPTINAGGKQLVLNGKGQRTKFVLTLYNAGLYVEKKNKDAKSIMNANQVMALRLQIVSGFISSEKMTHATKQGFANATGGKTAPIQAQINQFLGAFKAPIKKGDIFEFTYTPAGGTKVVKNRKGITVIKGLPFKKALFGIWLSNRPAQGSLKNQLLGK